MENKKEILLPSKRYKKAEEQDLNLNIGLETSQTLLRIGDKDIILDIDKLYDKERNESNKYKAWANQFRKKQRGHATVHAEIGAILGLDRSVTEGATIYVVRVGRDGCLRNSKPCAMCEAAMQYVGIKKVIYSNEDGQIESMRIYNE